MRYLLTVEVKDTPDDPLPDIDGVLVDWDLTLEEAWARARKISELNNRENEQQGKSQRGRVVEVQEFVVQNAKSQL